MALMRALSLPHDDAIHAGPAIAAVRRIDRHAELGDLDPVMILDFLDDLGQHRPGFFVELPVRLGIAKNCITVGRHVASLPRRKPGPASSLPALFATVPIMLAAGPKRYLFRPIFAPLPGRRLPPPSRGAHSPTPT